MVGQRVDILTWTSASPNDEELNAIYLYDDVSRTKVIKYYPQIVDK
jgi:hypothetical protein